MTVDRIFYADGHDVTVTDSSLTVKKKQYRLRGITRHGLSILKPVRLHGWLFIFTGLGAATCGALRIVPIHWVGNFRLFDFVIGGNGLALVLGVLFILVGLLIVSLTRPKYAVRIATAEGETDVVVSKQREYVRQIVEALNRAFIALQSKR